MSAPLDPAPLRRYLDGEHAEGGSEVLMRNLHSAIRIMLPKKAEEDA